MTTRWLWTLLVIVVLAAGCASNPSQVAGPPAACAAVARDDEGTVAAYFASTVGRIRALPGVANNPQLAAFPADANATVCYVDGHIPKGPGPPMSGTIPPSFDRAIIVVVDQQTFFIAAGYSERLPIQAP